MDKAPLKLDDKNNCLPFNTDLHSLLNALEWYKYIDYADPANNFQVYSLQLADSLRILFKNVVYNFNETGVGKTVTAGMSVLNYFDLTPKDELNILVVTYNNNCVHNFIRDWKKIGFREVLNENKHDSRMFLTYARGERRINVTLTNNFYTNIAGSYKYNNIDMIVVDEAHMFFSEGMKSKRYDSLVKKRASKVIFMTATPTRYDEGDIGRLEFLGNTICGDKNAKLRLNGWLRDHGNELPYSFDFTCPVSRYFKDTVECSNMGESTQIKRCEPEEWVIERGSDFYSETAKKLHEEVAENGNRCLVFVRTFNSSNEESEADKLINALEKIVPNRDDYECVSAENRYELEKYNLKSIPDIVKKENENNNAETIDTETFIKQRLKKILIVTKVAENGVNLNAFNRVVHLWIPHIPAVTEQRYGRIDRMLDKSTYETFFGNDGEKNALYDVNNSIGNIFPFVNDYDDNSYSNYAHALTLFVNDCLSTLPARNTLITKDNIKRIISENTAWLNHYEKEIEDLNTGKTLGFYHFKDDEEQYSDDITDIQDSVQRENEQLEKYISHCNKRRNECKREIESLKKFNNFAENTNAVWNRVFYNDSNGLNCLTLEDIFKNLEHNTNYNSFKEAFEKHIQNVKKLYEHFSKHKADIEKCLENIFFETDTDRFAKMYRLLLPQYAEWSNNNQPLLEVEAYRYFKAICCTDIFTDIFKDEDFASAYEAYYGDDDEKLIAAPLKNLMPLLEHLPVFRVIRKIEENIDLKVFKYKNERVRYSKFNGNDTFDFRGEEWKAKEYDRFRGAVSTRWFRIFNDEHLFTNQYILAHTIIKNKKFSHILEYKYSVLYTEKNNDDFNFDFDAADKSSGLQRKLFNYYIDLGNWSNYRKIHKAVYKYSKLEDEDQRRELDSLICRLIASQTLSSWKDYEPKVSEDITEIELPDNIVLLKCYAKLYAESKWEYNKTNLTTLMSNFFTDYRWTGSDHRGWVGDLIIQEAKRLGK